MSIGKKVDGGERREADERKAEQPHGNLVPKVKCFFYYQKTTVAGRRREERRRRTEVTENKI